VRQQDTGFFQTHAQQLLDQVAVDGFLKMAEESAGVKMHRSCAAITTRPRWPIFAWA
jgi:hypothetical protein